MRQPHRSTKSRDAQQARYRRNYRLYEKYANETEVNTVVEFLVKGLDQTVYKLVGVVTGIVPSIFTMEKTVAEVLLNNNERQFVSIWNTLRLNPAYGTMVFP